MCRCQGTTLKWPYLHKHTGIVGDQGPYSTDLAHALEQQLTLDPAQWLCQPLTREQKTWVSPTGASADPLNPPCSVHTDRQRAGSRGAALTPPRMALTTSSRLETPHRSVQAAAPIAVQYSACCRSCCFASFSCCRRASFS